MSKNTHTSWRAWTKGLLAAVITAVSSSALVIVVAPEKFSLDDLSTLGTVAIASIIIGAATYLKQKPLP